MKECEELSKTVASVRAQLATEVHTTRIWGLGLRVYGHDERVSLCVGFRVYGQDERAAAPFFAVAVLPTCTSTDESIARRLTLGLDM